MKKSGKSKTNKIKRPVDWRDRHIGLASENALKRKWRDDENSLRFKRLLQSISEIRKTIKELRSECKDLYLPNPNAVINGSDEECAGYFIAWKASFYEAIKNSETISSFSEEQIKFLLSNLRDNERLAQLLKQKTK